MKTLEKRINALEETKGATREPISLFQTMMSKNQSGEWVENPYSFWREGNKTIYARPGESVKGFEERAERELETMCAER